MREKQRFFTIDSVEQTVSITVNADMSNYRPNKRQRYHCQVALADALNKRVTTTWRSDISDLFKHLDLKLKQRELQLCYHLRVLSTTKITGLSLEVLLEESLEKGQRSIAQDLCKVWIPEEQLRHLSTNDKKSLFDRYKDDPELYHNHIETILGQSSLFREQLCGKIQKECSKKPRARWPGFAWKGWLVWRPEEGHDKDSVTSEVTHQEMDDTHETRHSGSSSSLHAGSQNAVTGTDSISIDPDTGSVEMSGAL
jgi:hypothetical protein